MLNLSPKSLRRHIRRSIAMAILCSPLFMAPSAQAVPLPKDWCGRLWEIQTTTGTNAVIGWNAPATGLSTAGAPPNVAAIPNLSATGNFAALGIHARSGTLYTLDRLTHILYQYNMGTATGWTPTTLTNVPSLVNGQPLTNFNKMTVTGDILLITNSAGTSSFSFSLTPATGAIVSAASTAQALTFDNNTLLPNGTRGNPPGTGAGIGNVNANIDGGDIAQDEYADTYMVTYDNYGATTQYAYFYKLVGTQWVFKDRIQKATSTDSYAGLAFYADTLYVKGTSGTLFKSALTRIGSDYDWAANASTLTTVGTGTGSTDLASCGVPAISVTKTQSIYTDPTATTLTTDQTRIGTGQYIKYTIIAINSGDAWARNAYLKDTLPAGVTYVPNSATENDINLNAATYPFTNTTATASGLPTGTAQIRLPIAGNSGTSTYTYIVKVDGTAPTVSNQAEVGYLNPYPSDPPNCATGLNCAVTPLETFYPSIFGTVWKDINGSANQSFANIFTTGEVGTNTNPLPTDTTKPLYALLLDSTGKVLLSQPIANDGTYAFQALNNNQTGLKIQLSTTAGTVGVVPAAASIPATWKATSPKITPAIALTTVDILNKDFGITLPAGIILVKRITAITDTNGATTNFNTVVDPTTTTTTNDDATRKWPAGYLKGAVDGGIVKPGYTIEYTIYYLNDGSADAKALKICDPIRGNQKYNPETMKLSVGGATAIGLSDIVGGGDLAHTYGAASSTAVVAPTDCNISSATTNVVRNSAGIAIKDANGNNIPSADNGGVAIQLVGTNGTFSLTAIPGATSAGMPANSYGFFRFTTKVNP